MPLQRRPTQLRSPHSHLFRRVRPALRGEAHLRPDRRAGGVDLTFVQSATRLFLGVSVCVCVCIYIVCTYICMYICMRVFRWVPYVTERPRPHVSGDSRLFLARIVALSLVYLTMGNIVRGDCLYSEIEID